MKQQGEDGWDASGGSGLRSEAPVPARTSLPAGRPRLRFRWSWLIDSVACLLTLATIATAGGLLMDDFRMFSRIDEREHYNYVLSLAEHGRIPRVGEAVLPETLSAEACQGSQVWRPKRWWCHSSERIDVMGLGWSGITQAGGYPPVYYLPTTGLALLIREPMGVDSLFLPARVVSLLWLVLGALCTYVLARRLRGDPFTAVGVALVAALTPLSLAQGTTINPDSMALLAGSGGCLVWLALRRRPGLLSILLLGLVLTVIGLVKPNFLVLPLALAVAEIAVVAHLRGPAAMLLPATWSWRRPAGRVLSACALGVLLASCWYLYFSVLDRPGALMRSPLLQARLWDGGQGVRSIVGALQPLNASTSFIPALDHSPLILLANITGLLAFAGTWGALLLTRTRSAGADLGDGRPLEPGRAVAYLAGSAMLLAAPVVFAITSVSGGIIVYPARYSLFVVPLGLVVLISMAGRRRAWLVAAVGVTLAVYTLCYLATATPLVDDSPIPPRPPSRGSTQVGTPDTNIAS